MRGKPFESGNKFGKGRPPGSRNKRTRFLDSLQSHGDAIIDKAKLMALQGDRTAMRLCFDRLLPVAKPPGTRFPLPKMETPADLKNVLTSVMKQTAKGRMNAFEAEAFSRVVDSQARAIATSDFDERIRALEEDRSERLKPVAEKQP
jgi:hypothetical protein